MRLLRFTNFIILFTGIVFILIHTSCATILSGKRNTISVKSGDPAKALVYLDGELLGETPLDMRIEKYKLQHGSVLEIRKEGFETMYYEVVRSTHVLYSAADILSGVIPLIIDVANGNIYRPNTRKVEYVLVPVKKS